MPRPRRRDYGFTERQRAELWTRWKAGESLTDIARALDKVPASIFEVIRKRGGITVTKTSAPTEQHQRLLAAIGAPIPDRHTAA